MAGKNTDQTKRKNSTTFFSVFFITLTFLVIVLFIVIYQNPYVIFNPFPPTYPPPVISQNQVDAAIAGTQAEMPTKTAIPSTETVVLPEPTPSLLPTTSTLTVTVQLPLVATATGNVSVMSFTHNISTRSPDTIFYTPTPTAKTGYIYPYILVHEPDMLAAPYNDNVSNPLLNCNWIGVAGQVFNVMGNPLDGILVRLSGSINGEEIRQVTMASGESNLLGEGGFEFALGEEPFSSENALWLQVIAPNGDPLSAKAHFSTSVHCTQNLIRIDFIQAP